MMGAALEEVKVVHGYAHTGPQEHKNIPSEDRSFSVDNGEDNSSEYDLPIIDGDANRGDVDEDEDHLPEGDAPGEGHVDGEVPSTTVPSQKRPTFFDLPLELRWKIYHLVITDNKRHEVDIVRLSNPREISPREIHKPKSYSWMLVNRTSLHDNVEEIGKSHPLTFFNLPELESFLPMIQKAYFIILDLGEVEPSILRKALHTLRTLPALRRLEIRCTPTNLEAARIPPGWDGFPRLQRVKIRDRGLERIIKKEKHDRAGEHARALEIVRAIDHERNTLDASNYRVRHKLPSLRPRPSVYELEAREILTQELIVQAWWDIRKDRSAAMYYARMIASRPWDYSFDPRDIKLKIYNKFVRKDVRQRERAREEKVKVKVKEKEKEKEAVGESGAGMGKE